MSFMFYLRVVIKKSTIFLNDVFHVLNLWKILLLDILESGRWKPTSATSLGRDRTGTGKGEYYDPIDKK